MAQVLIDHGWNDVYPLVGGFDAWRLAGLPVEAKTGVAGGGSRRGRA